MTTWFNPFLALRDWWNRPILDRIMMNHLRLLDHNRNLHDDLHVLNRAFGRIIAKIDPLIVVDETDPTRKAASDAIGDAVIARLKGEMRASNPFPRDDHDDDHDDDGA